MTIKVPVTVHVQAELTDKDLGHALGAWLARRYPDFDDAGCDLYTRGEREVCLGDDPEAVVLHGRVLVSVVNTMNILRYGHILEVSEPAKQELDNKDQV